MRRSSKKEQQQWPKWSSLPWSHNRPPQPSWQLHCHGSWQVPCLQAGYFLHSSQNVPCQPSLHLQNDKACSLINTHSCCCGLKLALKTGQFYFYSTCTLLVWMEGEQLCRPRHGLAAYFITRSVFKVTLIASPQLDTVIKFSYKPIMAMTENLSVLLVGP